jgi:uncharacterized protein YecE (DUF72 family)
MPATSPTPVLRVGPAGWLHSDWDGLVYPKPSPRGFHPLEFLADRFDTVEISQSFHEFIRPELGKLWAAKVAHNPRFQFTARLHRQFSHERILNADDAARWSEGLLPLLAMGKLGCVLMQFPAAFRFTADNKDFLIRVRRAFHQFPLVAEMRHASWTAPEAVGTMIDYHIGFCNIDQPESLRATKPTSLLTWRVGMVKLHGRVAGPGHTAFDDRGEDSGYSHLFGMDELQSWKSRVDKLLPFSQSMFVVFNNDVGGRAVVNGMQFQGMSRAEPQPIPRELRRAYRVQLADQPRLFAA